MIHHKILHWKTLLREKSRKKLDEAHIQQVNMIIKFKNFNY